MQPNAKQQSIAERFGSNLSVHDDSSPFSYRLGISSATMTIRLTWELFLCGQGWRQVQYMAGKFPWWVRPLTMRAMRVRIHDRIYLQVAS